MNLWQGRDSHSPIFSLFFLLFNVTFCPVSPRLLYYFFRVLEALFCNNIVDCYRKLLSFFLNCVVKNLYFLSDDTCICCLLLRFAIL